MHTNTCMYSTVVNVRVHCRLAYCSGRYPSSLVTAWEEWAGNPDNECENDHPGEWHEEACQVVVALLR